VEFVTRERYVLFRSTRIFADVVVMADGLRVALHLSRKVDHQLFLKVGADRRQVTHVAKLHDMEELKAMKPFLREAYEYSISY
jgi:predicted transport protein